jgi:hypothetical protein
MHQDNVIKCNFNTAKKFLRSYDYVRQHCTGEYPFP